MAIGDFERYLGEIVEVRGDDEVKLRRKVRH